MTPAQTDTATPKEYWPMIYGILIRLAGARPSGMAEFISAHSEDPPNEYRFQGALGFGGKYWSRENRISCYPEDCTPERSTMIQAVNEVLAYAKQGHSAAVTLSQAVKVAGALAEAFTTDKRWHGDKCVCVVCENARSALSELQRIAKI